MAKIYFKNGQSVPPGGIIKGVKVDFKNSVADVMADYIKNFDLTGGPFEISGTLDFTNYKPTFDPKLWAESQGLEVTDEGIYCYKAVYQLTAGNVTRYFAPRALVKVFQHYEQKIVPRGQFKKCLREEGLDFEAGDPFEYILNEEVKCGYFEYDQTIECAPGLYGASKEFAEEFMLSWMDKTAILKLFVPFENNTIIVPYAGYSVFPLSSDKIRFKRCIPVSAEYKVPTIKPSRQEIDNNYGWKVASALCEALDDPRLVLQIFSRADSIKYTNSIADMVFDTYLKTEE